MDLSHRATAVDSLNVYQWKVKRNQKGIGCFLVSHDFAALVSVCGENSHGGRPKPFLTLHTDRHVVFFEATVESAGSQAVTEACVLTDDEFLQRARQQEAGSGVEVCDVLLIWLRVKS